MKKHIPLELLKTRLKGRTQKALADELGVSPAYLSDILRGKRDPGPQVLGALGLERVVAYQKAGE